MAEPKGRPKKSERQDRAVKVDARIVSMAQMIAKGKGVSLAEYLSDKLRVPVEHDYGSLMEKFKGSKS